jgi:plasmid stabilization system protein ParE
VNQRPCTYTFTPRFDASVDQALAIISSYNVDKALELIDRIEALIGVITTYPEAYPTRDYLPESIRRCSFKLSSRYADPFALFYEFEESKHHVIFHLVTPGDWNFSRLFAP